MSSYKDFEDFVKRNKDLFDKHVAKVTKVDTGENDCIVEFKDPETNNGAMVFTYIKGYLSIQGDYGCGSFTWYNSRNTLEWMSNTGFCYFMSKLTSGESSEGSKLMREHDQDHCIASVEEYIKDYELEMPDDDWKEHTEDYYEWVSWLRENGEEYFGDDHYEWSYEAGITYRTRAYFWKYGLIKAVEYINNHNIKCDTNKINSLEQRNAELERKVKELIEDKQGLQSLLDLKQQQMSVLESKIEGEVKQAYIQGSQDSHEAWKQTLKTNFGIEL